MPKPERQTEIAPAPKYEGLSEKERRRQLPRVTDRVLRERAAAEHEARRREAEVEARKRLGL